MFTRGVDYRVLPSLRAQQYGRRQPVEKKTSAEVAFGRKQVTLPPGF
jgi:hypothetical protein